MTKINAYLIFNGRCREAMGFYKSCLGGELNMQTVAESSMGWWECQPAITSILRRNDWSVD